MKQPRRGVSKATYVVVIIVIVIILAAAGFAIVRARDLRQSHTSTTSFSSSSTSSSTSLTSSTSSTTLTSNSVTASSSSDTSAFVVPGYTSCVDASNEISGFTCASLAQDVNTWQPATNGSLGFSVVFVDASYDYLEQNSQSTLQAELNMLLSTGASCIRIDIGYDAWLQNNVTAQNELQGFVSQIKSDGKCLVIADAGAESYRSSPLTFSQFQVAWQSRVQTLASLFKPNYYIVIKELSWYAPMISDANTNPQVRNATAWSDLAGSLAATVLSVSPQTKIGVAIEGGLSQTQEPLYVNFLEGVSAERNISFIGFDPYGQSDLTLFQSIISQIHTTKSLWVAEAWSTGVDPSTGAQIMFNQDRAALDAYWIQVMYYYCLYIHASVLEPFYTDAFASYSQTPDFSHRTPVFYWFQHLATTYGVPLS